MCHSSKLHVIGFRPLIPARLQQLLAYAHNKHRVTSDSNQAELRRSAVKHNSLVLPLTWAHILRGQGRALMAPYLPRNGVSGSPYSEGGALYALGLIHANHGQAIRCGWRARGQAERVLLPWCSAVLASRG